MTVHVPLKTLPQLRAEGFEWLVPALRAELVVALIRSLPKELRKRLVPVPDVAAKVLERLQPRQRPAAGGARGRDRGPARRADPARRLGSLPAAALPADDVQRRGRERQRDRGRPGPRRAARAGAAERCARRWPPRRASSSAPGQTSWTFGTIPKAVALPGTGQTVRAYPSLVDEGETVGLRALESPEAQALNMRVGTRRLLALTIPSPLRQYQAASSATRPQLALIEAPHASPARRARGRGDGGDLVADGAGRRAGVGRGVLRRACATTSPATPRTRRPGSWPRS